MLILAKIAKNGEKSIVYRSKNRFLPIFVAGFCPFSPLLLYLSSHFRHFSPLISFHFPSFSFLFFIIYENPDFQNFWLRMSRKLTFACRAKMWISRENPETPQVLRFSRDTLFRAREKKSRKSRDTANFAKINFREFLFCEIFAPKWTHFGPDIGPLRCVKSESGL